MVKPAPRPVPEGMNTLTTVLCYNGNCRQAIEFYQKAFGAELVGQIAPTPDGKGIWHAMLKLGNSHIMLADAMPGQWEKGPKDFATASLFMYVEDCDSVFKRATNAGCKVIMPIMDMFWGDRMGKLKDPYGHGWVIATYKYVFTPEEMQKGQEEWLKSLKK
jgi:uncharacterized glyoxalase superfamily protein PhnB